MIPGLKYIPDYISEEEEKSLLALIDKQAWITDLKRRVQHYGYKYDYKTRGINSEGKIGEIPDWLLRLCKKSKLQGDLKMLPEQVIINEYFPGQGIAAHIDSDAFGGVIASLSLGSDCEMKFFSQSNNEKNSIILKTRSLIILSDEARYNWQHSIAARKSDVVDGIKSLRKRRVSLTFRTISKQ